LIAGGFDFSIRIRATHLQNPVLIILVLVGLRCIIGKGTLRETIRLIPATAEPVRIYLLILVLSFLFTFGKNGPYLLLYKFVPGFDGLRVASRFHIFFMLSLAILAAFGIKCIEIRLRGKKRRVAVVVISIMSLLEYLSIPIPVQAFPVGEQIPEVYKWLASQEGECPTVEIPFEKEHSLIYQIEGPRVYYSIYHRKRLLNGYSGYFPPLYMELVRRMEILPLARNIKDWSQLGIRYVILHSGLYKPEDFEKIKAELTQLQSQIRFARQFGSHVVYELIDREPLSLQAPKNRAESKLLSLGWQATSNFHPEKTAKAMDANLSTRWYSGPQTPGAYFQVDMQKVYDVTGVSLFLSKRSLDFPRGYGVETSADGKNWALVAEDRTYQLPIRSFLRPLELRVVIDFDPAPARYIKITQTGEDPVYYWSIYEIEVFAANNPTAVDYDHTQNNRDPGG
ncbi:MAG: discoidin domain-containing protein, partial [Desulfobacterales bacterium]